MPFFSLSISARRRLLATKAISIPEKNAERTIVIKIPIIKFISNF